EQIATFITNSRESDAWLLLASANSLQSEPCKEEFAYALGRALKTRGNHYPVIALFLGPVDEALIPPAITTRLFVSSTDPDWKERIVAAVEGRDLQVSMASVEPYHIQVHSNQGGEKPFAIEVRPRAGVWAPDAWNMKAVAYQGAATFWDVGYVCSLDPRRRGLGLADYYYQPLVYDKYWWCRECHWLPYWGKATCMRRDLMSELRDYWCNRWHNRAIPNIKAAIRDTTRMPEDVIGLLPAFIGCPYDAP
ncbi:MAG: hypothetical protein V3S14_01090, partial [Anaerolineae bacterium]